MKRDEVREGLLSFVDYVRDHGRQLVIGAGLVVIGALAVGGWLAYRSHQNELANRQLARAIELYEAPVDSVAPRPEDPENPSFADEESRDAAARRAFEEVASSYGGTRVAAVAAAYLGELAARGGELERARELWTGAVAEQETVLTAELLVNRLAVDRASGRGEEVLTELRGMLEDDEAPLPQVVLLDQIALTLESLERRDEALEIYQQIAEEFPQSAYSARARQQVQSL